MPPEPSSRAHNLDLPFKSPQGPLYRIARTPSPWTAPDWSLVGDDGTFGNRFDDLDGYFRVLYTGSSPLACFVETLARYRKPPDAYDLMNALNSIENSGAEQPQFGRVPLSWAARRTLGEAVSTRKCFADVYAADWVSYLRRKLEPGLMAKRLDAAQDFDLTLLGSQDRRLTQQIATLAYQLGYGGICYQSRHGADLYNWALFEPFELTHTAAAPIRGDDVNLLHALALLNLTLNPDL
jgi:hypothetical protein